MVKNHLKTIAAPKSWPVQRKSKRYIMRPTPSGHRFDMGMTLNYILIDFLKLAKTKRESTYLTHNTEVFVEGVRRKDVHMHVGLFDVVSIPSLKKYLRVVMDEKGKLGVKEIPEKEASLKPCQIIGKTQMKAGIQLNLYDGKNIIVKKSESKVGDSVLFDLAKKEAKEHLALAKGCSIFLIGGKHRGSFGTVEGVAGNTITYKIGTEVQETLKKYAFVVGKDKPAVTL